MEEDEKYNGWKNFETWNVALWISNDESLQYLAKSCKRARNPYTAFAIDLRDGWGTEQIGLETPDGVRWNHPNLDFEALDELIKEL